MSRQAHAVRRTPWNRPAGRSPLPPVGDGSEVAAVRRDVALVRRMAAGDEEALRRLYDRHAPALLSYLRGRYGLADEAEEVLQEAFLQAWGSAGRYDPAAATPRGWLFLLGRSRALDRLRSSLARVRRERDFSWPPRDSEPRGTAGLEARERSARLRRALRRLPGEQRRCVELAFFAELSHRQVAERLQQPLGTVKSRILLGLRKMRRELAAAA